VPETVADPERFGEHTPVAVKIKLKRLGKIHRPQYRVIVADSRTKRDGRAIEEIGRYAPLENPSVIEIDSERAQYWLGVGAQPTEAVAKLLTITGDMQKFTGKGDAAGTLEVAPARAGRDEAFAKAVSEAADAPDAKTAAAAARAKTTPVDEAAEEAEEVATEALEVVDAAAADEAAEVEAAADDKA
jgi:small subunit ribosomal protein S16